VISAVTLEHSFAPASDSVLGVPPQHEYDRYNAELDVYFAKYEDRMRERWERRQAGLRTVEIALSLHNEGGVPATDMDVAISFEGNGALRTFDPRAYDHGPPPLPQEPQFEAQLLQNRIRARLTSGTPPFVHDVISTMGRNVSRASADTKGDQHRITWSVKHLKHLCHVDFEPVYFVFGSHADAQSFRIDWNEHAGNYPETLNGQLHIIVRR